MDVTQYIATEGIRWDNISYLAFGDISKTGEIMDLNPDVPTDLPIPAGTMLYVPVFTPETVQNLSSLPPWKR